MFYVCRKLSEMEWNAMPTWKNAEGIDIVAYRPDGKGYVGIQVKTQTNSMPLPIGTDIEKIAVPDYWIIVVRKPEICAYILPRQEITGDPIDNIAVKERKKLALPPVNPDNEHKKYYIQNYATKKEPAMPHYNCKKYLERWDLI